MLRPIVTHVFRLAQGLSPTQIQALDNWCAEANSRMTVWVIGDRPRFSMPAI